MYMTHIARKQKAIQTYSISKLVCAAQMLFSRHLTKTRHVANNSEDRPHK